MVRKMGAEEAGGLPSKGGPRITDVRASADVHAGCSDAIAKPAEMLFFKTTLPLPTFSGSCMEALWQSCDCLLLPL